MSTTMQHAVAGLRGSICAVPTPFRDGQIDIPALFTICERQMTAGTSALVVCGSTGEASTLNEQEYGLAVKTVVQAADGLVPVIAGCTSCATTIAVGLAERAAAAGADALLCAAPPYNKPTQEGLRSHMRAVAHATALSVISYDVPSRSATAFSDETIAWLFEQGLIVGIKDATADLARPARLRRMCGGALAQWSGDDATAPAHRAVGGAGCISVTANVVPALCALMHQTWDAGDRPRFASIRDMLVPLHDALFVESNPVPVKAALAQLGLCTSDMRLPLMRASLSTQERLLRAMAPVIPAEEHAKRRESRTPVRFEPTLIAV